MKKTTLLLLALAAFVSLQAQWVDDPANNTFIVNCSADAGEVYTSTDPVSGDTYVQWTHGSSNGWSPTLQRLSFDGTPQWGDAGIHITTPNLASWSPGYAMAATNDGGVVSVFRTADAHHFAVRINADGTFPWGEHGLMLFDGQGGDRSEVMAGNDGGVWALGTDYNYTYMQYVSSDGTLGPIITVGNDEMNHDFGLMVPGPDNGVLLVYEKNQYAYTYYYEKELWVVGFMADGTQIAPEVQLMSTQTMGGSYQHYVVPDGEGGGYAFMWHAGTGAFNTYVFHFDQYGSSTISDLNGIPVHSEDPSNYYIGAYGTVDPTNHELIIAYEQTDATTQSQSRIYMNRITTTGQRLWGEGLLVADNTGNSYSDIIVDAYEDGNGFCVIYNKGDGYNSTVEAIGFDKSGLQLWNKVLSSNSTPRAFCENSTGFHMGQNVVAWVNSSSGGLYGQNIGTDGTMGEIPFTPIPSQCPGPENFQGEYVYDMDEQVFGVNLTWTPFEPFDLYYLYRTDVNSGEETTIEIEGTATSYFDETGIGSFMYQLKGASEACGLSLPATTPDGEAFFLIEVTGIEENVNEAIVNITRIYTMSGQCLKHNNVNELSNGIYILQGLTRDGQLVSQKVVVNR